MIPSALFWLTLAATVPAYWLAPSELRPALLAAVSALYLALVDPVAAAMVVTWLLLFWLGLRAAPGSGGTRTAVLLVAGVMLNLALFKYVPRLADELADDTVLDLALPLGVSYFTFKLIHYAVEVRRGAVTDRSLAGFASWMLLFPIFTAGPIERYDHFVAGRSDRWRLEDTVVGIRRIIMGLAKKLLVADLLLRPLLAGYDGVSLAARLDIAPPLPSFKVWGFLVLSYLVVYFDFAGYTDIAVGSSRLLGLRIAENFDWPLLARSPADFWRRWHMTLAGWCRSYVYMPVLGATRSPYLAVLVTFVVIGLWHAGSANWLLWGLYHGAGVAVWQTWDRYRRRLRRRPTFIGRIVATGSTFLFISVSFAFSTTDGAGAGAALRLLARAFGIA